MHAWKFKSVRNKSVIHNKLSVAILFINVCDLELKYHVTNLLTYIERSRFIL
jgi:hypothetical protein